MCSINTQAKYSQSQTWQLLHYLCGRFAVTLHLLQPCAKEWA